MLVFIVLLIAVAVIITMIVKYYHPKKQREKSESDLVQAQLEAALAYQKVQKLQRRMN